MYYVIPLLEYLIVLVCYQGFPSGFRKAAYYYGSNYCDFIFMIAMNSSKSNKRCADETLDNNVSTEPCASSSGSDTDSDGGFDSIYMGFRNKKQKLSSATSGGIGSLLAAQSKTTTAKCTKYTQVHSVETSSDSDLDCIEDVIPSSVKTVERSSVEDNILTVVPDPEPVDLCVTSSSVLANLRHISEQLKDDTSADSEVLLFESVSNSDSSIENNSLRGCTATTVRVTVEGKIRRFQLNEKQDFGMVFSAIANEFKIPVECVWLRLNETHTIKPTDTPASVHLGFADILEGYILNSTDLAKDDNHGPRVELKFLTTDRKTTLQLKVKRLESFDEIKRQYLRVRNLAPTEHITFIFDGEVLSSKDTPESLDLQDSDIIEVRLKAN